MPIVFFITLKIYSSLVANTHIKWQLIFRLTVDILNCSSCNRIKYGRNEYVVGLIYAHSDNNREGGMSRP